MVDKEKEKVTMKLKNLKESIAKENEMMKAEK
jgi:hypothetical protein